MPSNIWYQTVNEGEEKYKNASNERMIKLHSNAQIQLTVKKNNYLVYNRKQFRRGSKKLLLVVVVRFHLIIFAARFDRNFERPLFRFDFLPFAFGLLRYFFDHRIFRTVIR